MNDPRISKYVESGEGYEDAEALVAEFLDERNQRSALASRTFAASKTPEPQCGQYSSGWHAKLQAFVNKAEGNLAAIVAGTQLELIQGITLADYQLAAVLLTSSDDFETVLAQAKTTRKEREQSLEAKLIENGLPQSFPKALLAEFVTENYTSIRLCINSSWSCSFDLRNCVRAFIADGVDSSVEIEFFRYIATWTRYEHLQKLQQDRNLPAKTLICLVPADEEGQRYLFFSPVWSREA